MRKTFIGLAILLLLVGLVMMFSPEGWIKVCVILLGLSILLNGIYNIAKLRLLLVNPFFNRAIIIRGALSILVGLLAILLPLLIAKLVFSALLYGIAVYLLISSLIEGYAIYKIKDAGYKTALYLYEIAFSVVLALVFIFIPTEVGKSIVRFLGFIVCLGAAGLLLFEWKNKSYIIHPESVEDLED